MGYNSNLVDFVKMDMDFK